MNDNPLIQLFLNFPVGLQAVLGLWLIMLIVRLLDWVIFRNRMGGRYGLYSMRSNHRNSIFAWIVHPFIHGSWGHFGGNSIPFLILGTIIALPSMLEFLTATLIILFILNLGVWFFEVRDFPTVGASGLITGYFGFILLRGFFARDAQEVIIALVVLAFYYSLFRIIFRPQGGNVSNVGHFWGFIGGVLAAWVWPLISQQFLV
ncbi:MAG: rhomboid family intramembrane serine protease [Chloroflexi bacterium]|nr:rhomboid family intramembrane serine protease [Chloroflexota bacterium]